MHYKFAVFSTDRGGLVRRIGKTFVFVVATNPLGNLKEEWKKVGDTMPDGWLISPANQLAKQDVANHSDDFRSMLFVQPEESEPE